MQFRYAHAAHPDWSTAVGTCIARLQEQAGDPRFMRGANLGFLYVSDGLLAHVDEILATLRARTAVPSWVGATGIGICATGTEYVNEPAIAVMLAKFAPGQINVFSGTQRPPALGARTESGADAAYTALVHADPATGDLPELINDMAGRVQSGYVFGGIASSRSENGRCAMIADRVLSGGLSGVVFASDVGLASRVTQGVFPFSAHDAGSGQRRVTRAKNNVILELDDRSALDVLLEDAGIRERAAVPNDDVPRLLAAGERNRLQELGRRGLFVGIEPDRSDGYRERTPRSDYVVRHVVALDPRTRSVSIAAPIEADQLLRFCTRDENAARRDLVRICSEIREHLHERSESSGAPVEARGAVYVSCLGRGCHMFGEQSEELRVIQSQLGDVPLVGFYANGEIGSASLYAFTGVLTVFY
ncbi:MAG TPA: FIST N-terminal domain-containing protein [Burkholderiaceae bacterium]|nr:FIST N-terminal domain-containing protein [Burkholderiaceae bacterium]